uniref:Uncharacterized protein n=1 Tax=Panagrolaimus davidi TaxID=227884 RepID=A0A914RA93_9BILA
MNNGSLVLSYFAMEDDLDRINCLVDGEPGDSFKISYITTNDQVPVVKIKPVKIYSHPTQDVIIDCYLKRGNPLTTRIRWSKDNVNLAADGDKIKVLSNNSLLIRNSIHTDRGNYKCRAWNTRGKSWDGVDLFVEDAPNTVNAKIGGTLNDKSLTFGELLLAANFTPEIKSNDIRMTIDNLAGTQTTVTRSIMAVVSMPLAFLGYDSSTGAKPVKQRPGKFERITNYEFESGEKMKVKQKAKGFTDDSMDLDVEFEGEVPAGGDYENVEFDPMEEELIEDSPGHVTGNGKSAVRFGQNHKVPFRWRDSINFDENEDNDFIPDGETMKVSSQPEVSADGDVKIATTVGKLGRCPDGFTKIKGRCRDIDECTIDPEICVTAGGNNNSICVNFEGGYECQAPCAAGFKASSTDGTCVDIDECELNTADCAVGQECINTEGSFECQETCAPGYQANDSGICQDINECILEPCKAPMTCKNLLGTYACICPRGFSVENGTCDGLVINPEHPFKIMDYSTDAQNCPAGYYYEKGKCIDTDECSFDAPCAYKCSNTPGSFQCVPISKNSSLSPINLHLLPVKHGLPAETPLIRLTAHDHDGRVLRKSQFKIKTPTEFFLRPDSTSGGSATVLNKHILTSGTRHQIQIHSNSLSHDRKIKYKTDFLVFVSVSQYPF